MSFVAIVMVFVTELNDKKGAVLPKLVRTKLY